MILRNLFEKVKIEQDEKKTERSEQKLDPKLITSQAKDTADISASYLEVKDLISVSKVCRSSHALYSKSRDVKELLQAVVWGDLKNAEKMIINNPELLLERDTVKDYSGRVHSGRTAYQLALGASDFNVKDGKGNIVIDGMVEMIEKYFSKIPKKTSEEINQIIHNQYTGQFPKDYKAMEAKRIANDSAALRRIMNVITEAEDNEVTAITYMEDKIHKIIRKEKSERADALRKIVQSLMKAESDKDFEKAFEELTNYLIRQNPIKSNIFNFDILKAFNFDILQALYQFRNYLEPKGSQTFGKHFNYSLLGEAAQLYEKNHALFGCCWNAPKILFCWEKVFGFIERFVPAQDAQSIAQGLGNILEEGEKSRRSLDFCHGGGKYYPLHLDLDWEIGYNCAVPMGGRVGGLLLGRGGPCKFRCLFPAIFWRLGAGDDQWDRAVPDGDGRAGSEVVGACRCFAKLMSSKINSAAAVQTVSHRSTGIRSYHSTLK